MMVRSSGRFVQAARAALLFLVAGVLQSTAWAGGPVANNAPFLDIDPTPTLNTESEDAGPPSGAVGTPVSSLVDFASEAGGLDNVTDPDFGALLGIAINGADVIDGTWYFTLDGGANWTQFDEPADSSTLLLIADSNHRLYFEPNPDFNGFISSAFTFRAWDRTSGSDGGFVSTTTGGTNAFSDSYDAAVLTITAVNDAPVLDANKSPQLTAENEDAGPPTGAVGTPISNLVDFTSVPNGLDNVTDPDNGALLGIAITGVDINHGNWWYTLNGGSSWIALGSVSDPGALLLAANANTRIYLEPSSNYNGTISGAITFRAWDQTSGTAGSMANTSLNGGSTAFSAAADTAALTINAVDDGPVATHLEREEGGDIRIDFYGDPGRIYDVLAASTVTQMYWEFLAFRTADVDGVYSYIDPSPTNEVRFYSPLLAPP